MSPNAILLKRVVQALGMTGVALAEMITSMRDDGKVTAPETVSRWLNGTNPVEPAVMGWLRELLRTKAYELRSPLMTWPTKRSMMIAVSNLKGGVGTTTVAANLSTVARYDYGLKTTHVRVGQRDDFAQRQLQQLGIQSVLMPYETMLAYEPAEEEIVIVDVSRDAAYDSLNGRPDSFWRKFSPDILLVPADFGSIAEVESTRRFVEIEGHQGLIRLLHRPGFMDIDFSGIAAQCGFDVASQLFIPFFIPQSLYAEQLPPSIGLPWTVPDQQQHYIRLFEYLVKQAGCDIALPGDRKTSIKSMDLETLLQYVEPAVRSNRSRT